jgi:hypothetical protein
MTNPDTLNPRTVAEIAALREARIAAWSNHHSESRLPQFALIRDLRPLADRRADEWAREFRHCVAFAFVCIVAATVGQFFWSL